MTSNKRNFGNTPKGQRWGGMPSRSGSHQNMPSVKLEMIPITVPYPIGSGPNAGYVSLPINVYTCQDPFCSQQPPSGPPYNFNVNPNHSYYSAPVGPGPIVCEPGPCCYLPQCIPQQGLVTMETIRSVPPPPLIQPQLTSTPVPCPSFQLPLFAESPISHSVPVYPFPVTGLQQGFKPIVPPPGFGTRASHSVQPPPFHDPPNPTLQVGPELLRPQPLYPTLTYPSGCQNSPMRQSTMIMMKEEEEPHGVFPWSRDRELRPSHPHPKGCWCGLEYSKYCKFCMGNYANMSSCFTHTLYDKHGKIECPVLRSHVCKICGATGDNAHTSKFCPARSQQPGSESGDADGKAKQFEGGRNLI